MEDGLWPGKFEFREEHAVKSLNPYSNGRWSLTACIKWRISYCILVLILILMEDGLWQSVRCTNRNKKWSLNPYSNGRWSLTVGKSLEYAIDISLNPYSNGRWSLTIFSKLQSYTRFICLNPYSNGRWSLTICA